MKKNRLIAAGLCALLLILSGCNAAAMDRAERRLDAAENAVESVFEGTRPMNATVLPSTAAAVTKEQAQAIALAHAGLTEAEVTRLHTEYEVEDGIPQYDVEFHQGRWEYSYEIHAETGAILSFSKDD